MVVGSKLSGFVGDKVPFSRSGDLVSLAVFSVEFAITKVSAAMYFFIAACKGLKGREFWFFLPELALPLAWDKVVVSKESPRPRLEVVAVCPPSREGVKADVAFAVGKLEFAWLLGVAEATEFAILGRDKDVLIAGCLETRDGGNFSARLVLISSNKPWVLTMGELKKPSSGLERLNLLTSSGTLSISAAIALSSADSPAMGVGLLEVAASSPSMLKRSGFTDTSQINKLPAQRTASGAQTVGCIQ